jgi:hypothetical protein
LTGTPPWQTSTGGWTGDSCDGHTLAVNQTGSPNYDHELVWVFPLGNPRTCEVRVYVPATAATEVAEYDVYAFRTKVPFDGKTATQYVDQSVKKGQWVTLGTYAFPNPVAYLALTNRNGTTSSQVAASAAGLTCTG